jgi:cytoskeletal protein CcmA (bactofilin family)
MWKKEGVPDPAVPSRPEPAPGVVDRGTPVRATGERATIGRSITINGEVTGDEDLLIQGRVDGSVNLKQHSVTVGPEGEVKADITARMVMVDGKVEGNINAAEQVILRSSAMVEGDIHAPRVVLEDGALFRGGVDMGESLERSGRTAGGQQQAKSSSTDRVATAADSSAGSSSSNERKDAAGTTKGTAPQSAATGAGRS